MTHEANIDGSVRADRIEIDPDAAVPAPLPDTPSSGLVLVEVDPDHARTSAAHLLDFGVRWSAEGRRVLLADAMFDTPFLHAAAGIENGEGLSDALLYGTTLGRVATPLESGVRVACAGTVVGSPDAVRDHARWETIVGGFEEAGVLLVAAIPAGSDAPRLRARARAVVAFSPGDSASRVSDPAPAPGALGDDWGKIDLVATSGPEATYALEDSTEDAVVPVDAAYAPADVGAGSGADATPSGGTPGEDLGSSPGDAPAAGLGARPAAAPSSAPPRPSSEARRSSPLLPLLLLVLLGVVALGYFGVIEIPYITPTDLDITG